MVVEVVKASSRAKDTDTAMSRSGGPSHCKALVEKVKSWMLQY